MLSDHRAAIAAWRKAIAGDDGVGAYHYRLGELLVRHRIEGDAALLHLRRAEQLGAAMSPSRRPSWLPRVRALLAAEAAVTR